MASRHPIILKLLPFIPLGLILVGNLAPVSDSLENILLGMAIVILLAFSGSYYWQQRRERQADQSKSAAISSKEQM